MAGLAGLVYNLSFTQALCPMYALIQALYGPIAQRWVLAVEFLRAGAWQTVRLRMTGQSNTQDDCAMHGRGKPAPANEEGNQEETNEDDLCSPRKDPLHTFLPSAQSL